MTTVPIVENNTPGLIERARAGAQPPPRASIAHNWRRSTRWYSPVPAITRRRSGGGSRDRSAAWIAPLISGRYTSAALHLPPTTGAAQMHPQKPDFHPGADQYPRALAPGDERPHPRITARPGSPTFWCSCWRMRNACFKPRRAKCSLSRPAAAVAGRRRAPIPCARATRCWRGATGCSRSAGSSSASATASLSR